VTRDGAPAGEVWIRGPRLLLRPFRLAEIDDEWNAVITADPMIVPGTPDEDAFRTRLEHSGRMVDGRIDLAIDLDGVSVGRIQTFVPPGRSLPDGTYEVGIGLREQVRGQGYGREALAVFTDWLFGSVAAEVVEALTDPVNHAMRAVFDRVGWKLAGSHTEVGRDWVMYRITRD
jgi:RimJ/RimL family protein N-acetyltransferase